MRKRLAEVEAANAEHKERIEALKKSEQLKKTVLNSLSAVVVYLDRDLKIVWANAAAGSLAGKPREKLDGHYCYEVWCKRSEPCQGCTVLESIETEEKQEAEVNFPDGTIWLHRSYPIRGDDGQISFVTLTMMDITERKRMEGKLKESEEKYKSIVENSRDVIMLTHPDGKIAYLSPACREVLGYDPEELIGKRLGIVHPDDLEEVKNAHYQALQRGIGSRIVYRIHTKSGKTKWVAHSWSSTTADDELKMVVSIVRDITEHKLADEAIRQERDRAQQYLDVAGVMFVAIDADQRVILINKKGCEILGYEENEIIGRNWFDAFLPLRDMDGARGVFEKLMAGEIEPVEYYENHVVTRRQEERLIAWHNTVLKNEEGQITGTLSSGEDVTDKRKLEQEILRTSKLESVGMLAGGIAHDFNNLLTAILGNISLVHSKLHPEDDLVDVLERAEKASMQARDLTHQLLMFAKGGAPVKEKTSILDLIRDSAVLALRGSNVRCRFSIPNDLWPVEVDKGQIRQVISNLVVNAKQAMWEGGMIEVRAENISLNAAHAVPLKSNRCVKISVKDHGVGIPPENLHKIFDPYFTTRVNGSGLGLATAYSVIKNHGGHITAESELGAGTTFYFYLPVAGREIPAGQKEEKKQPTARGRVLVMDDEEMVRIVAGEMLEHIGYEAAYASSGEEAIRKYRLAREQGKPFHAIIVDMTVPGSMGGTETLKKLMEIDPKVNAIVSSGYSNDPVMADFQRYGFRGVVVKPYKIPDLREALGKVIGT